MYRRDYDAEVICDWCDWAGWVDLTEDAEDLTAWWHCPGCGQRHDIILTDERGLTQVLFIVLIATLAVTAVGILGRNLQLTLGGFAVLTIITGIALGNRKANP